MFSKLNLIPTEAYHYSINDIVRALTAITDSSLDNKQITLSALGNGLPIRSARVAIILSIKALGLEPGSKIGVPLYCCPVVFKAIKMANCQLKFLDVDPETFCISTEDLRAKYNDLAAVVPVHMFGNLCSMDSVVEIMHGKPIIEDCAQALGSMLNGRLAGSMGTVSVFSFRSGKYISAGEGAAIYSNQAELSEKIANLIAGIEIPSQAEEVGHVFKTYLRSKLRSKPFWGAAGSLIWRMYNEHTDFIEKSPIIIKKIYKSDFVIAQQRLAALNNMIKAQRANANYYINNLQLDPSMMCHEMPGSFYNRFMFPVIFRTREERNLMREALYKHGVSTATPYEEVIEGAAKYYGYEQDCPVSERLLRKTLIIPCNYGLTQRETKHIVQSFNEAWENISS